VLAGNHRERSDATSPTSVIGTTDAPGPAGPTTRSPARRRLAVRPWRRARPGRYRLIIRVLLVFALIPVLLATTALTWLSVEGSGNPPATIPATGGDALWLGHPWVDGSQTSADLTTLVARVKQDGIRDLFVHDGPLSGNGSLDPRLSPDARSFVASVHRRLPGVRVQAWLGDLVGPGNLDLDSAATRSRILSSVDQALADGFDGIHFDMEPVASGDQGYLDLLAATHQLTRGRGKVLSIAAQQVEPLSGLSLPASIIAGQSHYWSASYLSAIARDVDEVALMTYDTGMPLGAAYSGFVRLETGIALRAMPSGVHLLIGLPANAIRGVRLALGTAAAPHSIGVSMYADFSATKADWTAYAADWATVRRS
jgi:hypothetical protein